MSCILLEIISLIPLTLRILLNRFFEATFSSTMRRDLNARVLSEWKRTDWASLFWNYWNPTCSSEDAASFTTWLIHQAQTKYLNMSVAVWTRPGVFDCPQSHFTVSLTSKRHNFTYFSSYVWVFSRKWGHGCLYSDSLLANPWIAFLQKSLST